MSFDDKIYEQIESYLNDQMNESEKASFENLMNNDDELASFVDTYTTLDEVFNENEWNVKSNASVQEVKTLANEFRSNDVLTLSESIRDIQRQGNQPEATKRKKSYFYIISSAVAVAAVVTLFYFSFMQSITAYDAFEQYHNWEALPSFVEKGDSEDMLSKAETLFEEEKYQESLAIFKEYEQQNTSYDPKIQLYIGVCHLELNDYTKAIKTFNALQKSNTIDNHKAYWYTALTYLKQNDAENAKKALTTLLQKSSNYNYEKAKELLKKLK